LKRALASTSSSKEMPVISASALGASSFMHDAINIPKSE
jgi:hypothetical protein